MFKVCILGNVTAEPTIAEREYTDKNTGEIIKTKVCNFSVAANDGYGNARKTEYFRIHAWRGQAENCMKYLYKGRKVYIEGPVTINSYVGTDKQFHCNMEVRADEIEFCGKGKQNEDGTEEDDGMPY